MSLGRPKTFSTRSFLSVLATFLPLFFFAASHVFAFQIESVKNKDYPFPMTGGFFEDLIEVRGSGFTANTTSPWLSCVTRWDDYPGASTQNFPLTGVSDSFFTFEIPLHGIRRGSVTCGLRDQVDFTSVVGVIPEEYGRLLAVTNSQGDRISTAEIGETITIWGKGFQTYPVSGVGFYDSYARAVTSATPSVASDTKMTVTIPYFEGVHISLLNVPSLHWYQYYDNQPISIRPFVPQVCTLAPSPSSGSSVSVPIRSGISFSATLTENSDSATEPFLNDTSMQWTIDGTPLPSTGSSSGYLSETYLQERFGPGPHTVHVALAPGNDPKHVCPDATWTLIVPTRECGISLSKDPNRPFSEPLATGQRAYLKFAPSSNFLDWRVSYFDLDLIYSGGTKRVGTYSAYSPTFSVDPAALGASGETTKLRMSGRVHP